MDEINKIVCCGIEMVRDADGNFVGKVRQASNEPWDVRVDYKYLEAYPQNWQAVE